MSDDDSEGPDGDSADGRYVSGHWGSAPELMYLAAVTGGLSVSVARVTGSPALGVRRIPHRGLGFVRFELLAPVALGVAEALKSADMAEIARLGPWVSEWPSYCSSLEEDGVEVDLGEANPVWRGVEVGGGADYVTGKAEADAAVEVFSDVLGSCLEGGPMEVSALVRSDGRGAVRVDLAPWDGEWMWLVLAYLGSCERSGSSPGCERAHEQEF
ncbi:hypothetical protein KDK95_01385 [Actinospica sp. MGRD01-02]|uniref:Uncharacterized protein n=1 Tax=Actinospica acidithermotolerans TaxID=2828514 RepID=A0A941E5S3_9ACTN|nr:hypothetical protein [Actinospica acidithermotolerans]MBR7824942.1 hypothetical protein [Actinospica acidithermotolerans]